MSDETLLKLAIDNNADNNAEWCDAVCRSHGMIGSFAADAWVNHGDVPRFYPNIITLGRSTPQGRVVELLDRTVASRPSVKDSFGALDLSLVGFELVFKGDWIVHTQTAEVPIARSQLAWRQVLTEAELAEWEEAWAHGSGGPLTFLPVLLRNHAIEVWAGHDGDQLVAGGIAFTTSDVVGLSNMFFNGATESALRGLVRAIAEMSGGTPLVGYEHGDMLHTALSVGFRRLGPLAVWVRMRGGLGCT